MATRRRSPPERPSVVRLARSSMFTCVSASRAMRSSSALSHCHGARCGCRPISTASSAVVVKDSSRSCISRPRRRAIGAAAHRSTGVSIDVERRPRCGRRSPASVCSVSVLPQPLRPRIAVNSPLRNSMERSVTSCRVPARDAHRMRAQDRRRGLRGVRGVVHLRSIRSPPRCRRRRPPAASSPAFPAPSRRARRRARHDLGIWLRKTRFAIRLGIAARDKWAHRSRRSYLSVAPSVCIASCAITTLFEPRMRVSAKACTTPTSPFCRPSEWGTRAASSPDRGTARRCESAKARARARQPRRARTIASSGSTRPPAAAFALGGSTGGNSRGRGIELDAHRSLDVRVRVVALSSAKKVSRLAKSSVPEAADVLVRRLAAVRIHGKDADPQRALPARGTHAIEPCRARLRRRAPAEAR